MPKIKSIELPADWNARIIDFFVLLHTNNIPIPDMVIVEKLLQQERVKRAYENLIRSGGYKKGSLAIVYAIIICSSWFQFLTYTEHIKINILRAKRFATVLREAKTCPLLDESGRHSLEVAARFYDLMKHLPKRRGRPKETFVMALAVMLRDVFVKQVGKPVYAAIGGLVEAVFGGRYDQDSTIKLVKRGEKDNDVQRLVSPPAVGSKEHLMRQYAIEKLTKRP